MHAKLVTTEFSIFVLIGNWFFKKINMYVIYKINENTFSTATLGIRYKLTEDYAKYIWNCVQCNCYKK